MTRPLWTGARRLPGFSSRLAFPVALACLLSVLPGCTEPRAPGRDPCYLKADADALRRYLAECEGYDSTRDCPAAGGIEADHQAAQQGCP